METVEVKTKAQQRRFLAFRKQIYRRNPTFVDNSFYLIKTLFSGKTPFLRDKTVYPLCVEDGGRVLCQAILIYAAAYPAYFQLCFFESEPDREAAVDLLMRRAEELGKKHGCRKLVIGLCGHVNYGLGLLCSHFAEKNSFSENANPAYYLRYLEKYACERVLLHSYHAPADYGRMPKYGRFTEKLKQKFTFQPFDRKKFDTFSEIFTDLNNRTFRTHRYYYPRTCGEDREMLKQLFLFMPEDSLFFAFDGNKPVGFILWYPDFNELAKPGDVFGVKHFVKNLFSGKKVKCGKIMEYGVLEEYRKSGVLVGLLNEVSLAMQKHHISEVCSSWVLDENRESNEVCRALCAEVHKEFAVYEKELS